MPRLKSLELHKNKIGDNGMQALASAFAGGAFRELEVLGLRWNKIGDAGLTAFAAALKKGALPALSWLWVDRVHMENPRLKAACDQRGVHLQGYPQ